MKISLQNDGSDSVFKSSYTSWRPIFETPLQGVYVDVLQTVFNLHTDVMKIQPWYCWERLEYQFWKERQAWASTRLEKWSWGLWKYVFRTTGRLTFLSLHTRLGGQCSRLIFKTAVRTCCKQYLTVLKGRQAWASRRLENWFWGFGNMSSDYYLHIWNTCWQTGRVLFPWTCLFIATVVF